MVTGYSATLNVNPKSMTLKKSDIKILFDIISKAKDETDNLYNRAGITIKGKKESISSSKMDNVLNARWPSNIENLTLYAESKGKKINVRLSSSGLGYNEIEISGIDIDWVSARVKELEDFVTDHRNMHWFFQNWISLFLQCGILWILILFVLSRSSLSGDIIKAIGSPILIAVVGIYYGITKIYPFVFVDNEKQDFSRLLRKVISFLLGTCVAGLICTLIANLV